MGNDCDRGLSRIQPSANAASGELELSGHCATVMLEWTRWKLGHLYLHYPSDYEQIMQLHSMLYITSYSHSLFLYTPFVPKLKNLSAPAPVRSEPSAQRVTNQIHYVPPTLTLLHTQGFTFLFFLRVPVDVPQHQDSRRKSLPQGDRRCVYTFKTAAPVPEVLHFTCSSVGVHQLS